MKQQPVFIQPDWPAPANVRAYVSTRQGGVSSSPYDGLNLGGHVGDAEENVRQNRALVSEALALPAEPAWLEQLHTTQVVDAAEVQQPVQADASYSCEDKVVCAVMTADCLPVFFTADNGSEVAVAHAGWRGLASGILEATLEKLSTAPDHILCWLGPAIGPQQFEVGGEVRKAFLSAHTETEQAFTVKNDEKWLADIYQLARLRLQAAGVDQVFGGNFCTYNNQQQFFSYRRDKDTGRMASLIWKL